MRDTSPASAGVIGKITYILVGIGGAISLSIILGVVFLALLGKEIPQTLTNWGGTVLGFYLGSSLSFIKDLFRPSNQPG